VTVLVPMSLEFYGPYLKDSVERYAEDNISSGRWPGGCALQRSHAAYDALLPKGLATPDNHLFEIKDAAGQTTVGAIWFAVVERSGNRSAHVFDVYIIPEHRRQGHAIRALNALEPRVRELGLSSIGLHVFGDDLGAHSLYAKLGYGVTGIDMLKRLGK
jgi:ribosomal protein S18 acetylase RimI-like enzyme